MAVLPFLQLMRPANIVTAWADVMVGSTAAYALLSAGGAFSLSPWMATPGWLLLSTSFLYGGGVVLNDVFDAEIDRVERPERPIPSGKVTLAQAGAFGILLLLAGIACAAMYGPRSTLIAVLVAALAVTYDALAKDHVVWGPLCMGACRGGNLWLGLSVLPLTGHGLWLALLPIAYIAAITLVSRGEVGGGSRQSLYAALATFSGVILAILALLLLGEAPFFPGLPFLGLFAYMIYPPLLRAIENPSGPLIGKAVKAGVIALIAFDAALATALAGWPTGLLILALLPLSGWLATLFAVT